MFPAVAPDAPLELIRGDLRDVELLRRTLAGSDAVIHLACISNDPSFELDPALGKSINFDSFRPLVEAAREAGVLRFVYASSSSVYGVKQEPNVTEELSLEPLTDYSRFKAECEKILAEYQSPDFTTVVLRPATVCGYSPRLRLDLSVNILTNTLIRTAAFGSSAASSIARTFTSTTSPISTSGYSNSTRHKSPVASGTPVTRTKPSTTSPPAYTTSSPASRAMRKSPSSTNDRRLTELPHLVRQNPPRHRLHSAPLHRRCRRRSRRRVSGR